ncbi:hypothetical protein HX014_04805 [Myroides marinus]|nr:hypothetical protein [Myroides marinus]MDM1349919.1 hypothetical protein [Myroides marinus]MDM1357127.1 hypothetical protein [Myroides marinus]
MKLVLTVFTLFFVEAIYSQTLHLYGGQNHDTYLGCLNCSSYESSSIWNSYGTYGNEYNTYSPWNTYSNNPPVVVDKEGNFYGYFTVNEYKAKRYESKLGLVIYKNYKEIRSDVSEWYDLIFN